MYRLFQRFTPAFLRKLDHQLLVSRPGLWATRIHYLLFYWLMGAGLASLLLMLMPIQLHNVPKGEMSTIMLMIVSVKALLAWAVQLAHYQPWKQGESHWRLHALRDQAVYFFGVGILILLPLGFSMLHLQKVDLAIDDSELEADMAEFESLETIFEWGDTQALETNLTADEMIQRYQVLAAKYGPRDLVYALDREDMLHKISEGRVLYDEMLPLQVIQSKVEMNFHRLERAEKPLIREMEDWGVLLAVWASFSLVLLLYVRSSWQTLLLSILSGLGLILVEAFVMGIAFSTNILNDAEATIVFLLVLNWLVLGGLAFLGEVKSSRQLQIRMVALSLFTVLTTLIPVITKEMLDGGSDSETLQLYLVSCGITFLLWNLFLQGRMLKLAVSPKKQ